MPWVTSPGDERRSLLPGRARHMPGGETASGAIAALRLLLVLSVLVPLLFGAAGGYLSYQANDKRAVAALTEAAAVAAENTTKVLDTHMLVAARIGDLLAGLSEADIRAREQMLHDRIAAQIKDLPQVAAAWVVDASGHELVSARVYPVDFNVDNSDRDDFRALRDGHEGTFIWALRARSLEGGKYAPYFTVSRSRKTSDGVFDGIIVVAVSGDYFASFYNALLDRPAQYTASVLREDGTVLARYPETTTPALSHRTDELLTKAITAKETGGVISSGTPFGNDGSIVAYRRLASYPVYVAIGRSRGAILREWFDSVTGYALLGTAATLALMLLSLNALRRTRREQAALAQANAAIAERAAIEAQLHQAQKMEAVGLLTAGIAHDFNNLLTVVAGNISLLQTSPDDADGKRERLIASASAACERAATLTKRLLGFARREPIDPRPVDVNEVIASVSELPWRALGDQIATEIRVYGRLWPVFTDPNQLENALLNLAINARDAMVGRGTLRIETANHHATERDAADKPGVTPGEYVAIIVSDSGCGMPPEVRERAFDPFFTTKGADKGSGLGLSQVYGFVTRFGGHCTIDSEPGHGTTVKLFLPRYTGTRERPADATAEDPQNVAPLP